MYLLPRILFILHFRLNRSPSRRIIRNIFSLPICFHTCQFFYIAGIFYILIIFSSNFFCWPTAKMYFCSWIVIEYSFGMFLSLLSSIPSFCIFFLYLGAFFSFPNLLSLIFCLIRELIV